VSNSRERALQTRLGHLRAVLSRGELVRTLIYLGAFGDPGRGRGDLPAAILAEARDRGVLAVRTGALARYLSGVAYGKVLEFRDPADAFFESLGSRDFRVDLEAEGRVGAALESALLEALLEDLPSPRSHYGLTAGGPESKVVWSWPLRVGTLSGHLPNPWLPSQGTSAPFRMEEMLDLRPLDGARGAFDVLAFPGGLEAAIQAVLEGERLPRVHTLVVLGEGPRRKGWLDRLAFLRRQSGAGLILWIPVPEASRSAWLEKWVEDLCHDLSVASAGAAASRRLDLPAPLVFGSASLMDARVSGAGWNIVSRAFHAARAAPPAVAGQESRGVRKPGLIQKDRPNLKRAQNPALEALAFEAARILEPGNVGAFEHEYLGARSLASLSRRLDDLSEDTASLRQTDRFVQVSVRDEATIRLPHKGPLVQGRSYVVQAWIGAPATEGMVFKDTFPESQLPPSRDGHTLTVVFTAPGLAAQPQVQKLWLPRTGDSKKIAFLLPAMQAVGPFRSRLMVLYRNRVLQTIILAGSVGQGPGLHLEAEFEHHALSGDLDSHPAFDAALLFNHGEDGEPAATVVAGGKAQWLSLTDTVAAAFPAKIQALLNTLAGESWKALDLMDPQAQELLANLARNGSELYRKLDKVLELDAVISGGARVQVLAANPDSVFPVEFLYVDRPPDAGATLCPHAPSALLGQDRGCAEGCGRHAANTVCKGGKQASGQGPVPVCPGGTYETVCPFGFWGIDKIVERQNFQREASEGRPPESLRLSAGPTLAAGKIRVLRSILLGASDKATEVVPSALDSLVQEIRILQSGPPAVLKAWSDWRQKVSTSDPSLLILVAHTDKDPSSNIATVEIGSNPLFRTSIDERYVLGSTESAPMVWLLGCSTAASARDTASLVSAFMASGAKVVVGTLAPTLGRRVGPVAEFLLGKLSAALQAGPARLGEVMRMARKELLAQGELSVLNLIAVGDSDWEMV